MLAAGVRRRLSNSVMRRKCAGLRRAWVRRVDVGRWVWLSGLRCLLVAAVHWGAGGPGVIVWVVARAALLLGHGLNARRRPDCLLVLRGDAWRLLHRGEAWRAVCVWVARACVRRGSLWFARPA